MQVSVETTFAALGDPQRKAVVDLLSKESLRAGEIAAQLGVTPAALSRHLRALRRSGLIAETGIETDARVRIYSLRKEPFDQMRDWVGQVQQFWAGQLTAYAEHVKRSTRRKL